MNRPFLICAVLLVCFSYLSVAQITQRPEQMTFFITGVGMGNGGNLGGLAGADKHCQTLAQAVGSPASRTWRAYLSTQAAGGRPAINARDRIAKGPWFNVIGAEVALNLALLHGDAGEGSIVNRAVAVNERGRVIEGERHDILTGTQENGLAFTDRMDHTCNNWTSNSAGSAQVGHHDMSLGAGGGGGGGGGQFGGGGGGGGGDRGIRSFNSSHATSGCSQAAFESTKSNAGLFYCFATN